MRTVLSVRRGGPGRMRAPRGRRLPRGGATRDRPEGSEGPARGQRERYARGTSTTCALRLAFEARMDEAHVGAPAPVALDPRDLLLALGRVPEPTPVALVVSDVARASPAARTSGCPRSRRGPRCSGPRCTASASGGAGRGSRPGSRGRGPSTPEIAGLAHPALPTPRASRVVAVERLDVRVQPLERLLVDFEKRRVHGLAADDLEIVPVEVESVPHHLAELRASRRAFSRQTTELTWSRSRGGPVAQRLQQRRGSRVRGRSCRARPECSRGSSPIPSRARFRFTRSSGQAASVASSIPEQLLGRSPLAGKVDRAHAVPPVEELQDRDELLAQRGLPAGEPDLVEAGHRRRDPLDLGEARGRPSRSAPPSRSTSGTSSCTATSRRR